MSEQQSSRDPGEKLNPYSIKRQAPAESTTRPDQVQQMNMVSRRKQFLPTLYGMWWMATLVMFLLAWGLGSYHALVYFNKDPFSLTVEDLREKYVFMSLGGSLLGSLFLIWVLQNTAKGLTATKPDPVSSYNNFYGAMVCLLIVGSMKLTSDVAARTTDTKSGGQLAWLRANAYGSPDEPGVARGAQVETGSETDGGPGPETVAEPAPVVHSSPSGRNLPQAQPDRRSSNASTHVDVRLGDPSKAIMAAAMRSFQETAGQVRMAEQLVSITPEPDLSRVSSAAKIEAVAEAHLTAFEAHHGMARMADRLPETARVRMLEAGCGVDKTEEQVDSLVSLLSLESAATIHKAEAAVHGARAAYAGYLAEHFGSWTAVQGHVSFDDPEAGAVAVELQGAIGQRELELKAAKYDASSG